MKGSPPRIPKKAFAVRLGVGNRAVERVEVDGLALGLHIHPAPLAAQVAGVDDREVKERRKVFAALDPVLEALNREHPLHAEVPHEFPEQPRIGRAEDAEGEGWEHGELKGCRIPAHSQKELCGTDGEPRMDTNERE